VELGALSAKASTSQIEALNAWASHLGELFQLTDDLLDATASTETMGKRTGKDEGKSKLTGVRVYGLPGLRDRIQSCRQDALDALQSFGPEASDLRLLTQEMADRSR
jgi:geranylgeranyl pyrophosphate synthase